MIASCTAHAAKTASLERTPEKETNPYACGKELSRRKSDSFFQIKSPPADKLANGLCWNNPGSVLLSHGLATIVSSALEGLTSFRASWIPSEHSVREGEAPKEGTDLKSVPNQEGTTRAPIIDGRAFEGILP